MLELFLWENANLLTRIKTSLNKVYNSIEEKF